MKSFSFSYPTRVYFGVGSSSQALEKELPELDRTVMLAYGGGSVKRNGIYDEIIALLKRFGKDIVEFGGIMPNPTYRKVQEGAALVRERKVDLILALGGGSVIDCSKVIAAQAELCEDIWDMEFKEHRFPSGGVPVGAVVTASGTGAEMNAGGVITHEEKKWKGGIFGVAPTFAVLDPEYTATVPRIQVFSGAFDTLSHAMETYFGTSDGDNVSDEIALAVMKNTVVNMRRLIEDIDDMEARSNLMWDSAMAENGILKCGKLTCFQVHQIEHQLGAYTDCNHGQGLAVIHPAYYRRIVKDAPEKFERFAETVFGETTAEDGVRALGELIEACGLPTELRKLDSKTEITAELLRQVADTSNIISSGPRELTRDEIYDILMECM